MDEEQLLAISKFVAPDSDIRAELSLPPDAKIQFIGRPILALDPRFNNGTAPARLLHHPLVEGRYFFTLPRQLWDLIHGSIGQDAFDGAAVELEQTLSDMCGDHTFNVGFSKGGLFTYSLLREPPKWLSTTEKDASDVRLRNAVRAFDDNGRVFRRDARAYVGWLLTNKAFLDEHDAIFQEWHPTVLRWGVSRLGLLPITGMFLPGDDPAADSSWTGCKAAFDEFFTRWRLAGLAAPYLPMPLTPLMAGTFPLSVISQLNKSCGVFCLPDTFAVPSRDTLRNLLDEALHGSRPPEHLEEWWKLISRGNAAKRALLKYSRLFEIQHYWRIVLHRHPKAVRGNLRLLKEAISSFLGVTVDTVHRDLLWLRKRLGPNWADRGQQYPEGPF